MDTLVKGLFKTADRYIFDSIVLDNNCIAILDGYVKYIRPLLQPNYSYLLINRNGKHFCKLTDPFSILGFEAIGKYENPTRYRHIIETERSREVVLHGQPCLKKLRGEGGVKMEKELQYFIQEECSDTGDSKIVCNEAVEKPFEDANSNEINDEEIVISLRTIPVWMRYHESKFIAMWKKVPP